MTSELSPNTQAVLLLTAPLIVGRSTGAVDALSLSEYNRVAKRLREIHHQPADLIAPGANELLNALSAVAEEDRLRRLLARGFLLSQVVERWRARAIWVISRADSAYPRRLKARLREEAPPLLYGCGDLHLLDRGGLAVVGSRQIDDSLIAYTTTVAQLAARAGKSVVSGGAKGVDRSAMRGALEEGGRACGVLADSLETAALSRENREFIIEGRLALVSRCDPNAGFNVGNAMQRNKVIYALADLALVVNSDFNKGGTWTGAVEQLERLRVVPVYVRSVGQKSVGLEELRRRGALEWPEPRDATALEQVFKDASVVPERSPGLPLAPHDDVVAAPIDEEQVVIGDVTQSSLRPEDAPRELPKEPAENPQVGQSLGGNTAEGGESRHAADLIASVGEIVQKLLVVPMTEAEVAAALNVSLAQARMWLQRFVREGKLNTRSKPLRYVVRSETSLMENQRPRRRGLAAN
jgi:DNA processing protein